MPAHTPIITASLSGHRIATDAAEQVCESVQAQFAHASSTATASTPDLAILFFSTHHLEAIPTILPIIHKKLAPGRFIAVSARDVLAGETELESTAGLSLFAASLSGTTIDIYDPQSLPAAPNNTPDELAAVASAASMDHADHRATILFLDPYSVPANSLLSTLTKARATVHPRIDDSTQPPILGGMASAGDRPGTNLLVIDDHLKSQGGVAIALRGNIDVQPLVSQGCRPIGEPMIITKGKGQLIFELAGKRAGEVLAETLDSLPTHRRQQLQKGLFVGRAVSEYKDRFGRDDFLIRNVIGVEKNHGAIAIADLVRTGQTIQFHIRDSGTADDDLQMLLDRERLYEPPAGALLFSCTGRGQHLFDEPHHDARAFVRAFGTTAADGASRAKAGEPVERPDRPFPLAGFFAAGEIGPVGDGVYVHGHSACAALFRQNNQA